MANDLQFCAQEKQQISDLDAAWMQRKAWYASPHNQSTWMMFPYDFRFWDFHNEHPPLPLQGPDAIGLGFLDHHKECGLMKGVKV